MGKNTFQNTIVCTDENFNGQYLSDLTIADLSQYGTCQKPTATPPNRIPCPSDCSCRLANRIVDCSNRGLTQIPPIPYQTDYINLSNNSISNIRLKSFVTGKSLLKVDLSNNIIQQVPSKTFLENGNLIDINLSNNLI